MTAVRRTTSSEPPRFIDLFAGIGGMRIPFDELGYKCVFSSEWDASAARTYEAWFGDRPAGDIAQVDVDDIPAHELLVAGFPCQAFSIMGNRRGFADTRGTLFFEIERVLRHHRPAMVLLENVKQLRTHDGGRTLRVIVETLEAIGYAVDWQVLNALDFGLPQKRERILIVGFADVDVLRKFEWPMGERDYDLSAVLEPDASVDRRHFASPHIVARRRERVAGKAVFYPSVWHENKSGNISVLDYSCALRTGASYNYLIVNGVRRPTPRELLRLQGFPDRLPIVVSYHEVRRQTGNAVPVSMIRAVARAMEAARRQVAGEDDETTAPAG
jgi:DNA (cytosine-5)-methyltransferase 1